MRLRLSQLSKREKIVVGCGSILLLCITAYAWIWSPLASRVEVYKNEIAHDQALLTWLMKANRQVKAYNAQNIQQPQTVSNIMTVVERSLATAELAKYLKQVSEPEQNQVSIELQNVPFDQFIGWLQQFTRHYQVKIIQCEAKQSDDSGLVQVQFTLAKQ